MGQADPLWRAHYLEVLRQTGNHAAARRDASAPRAEVDALLADSQDFSDDVAEAIALFQYEQVEDPIRKRATEGVQKAIYWNGTIVGWETHYSDKLLLAMAKAHVDRYRERVEVTGLPTAAALNPDDMSPESQEQLRELIVREMKARADRHGREG